MRTGGGTKTRQIQAVQTLRAFEAGSAAPSDALREACAFQETVLNLFQAGRDDPDIQRLTERLSAKILSRIEDETRTGGKRHRLLRRYAREAKAKRDAAFAAWIESETGVRDAQMPKRSHYTTMGCSRI
jgi:hypothetical protein